MLKATTKNCSSCKQEKELVHFYSKRLTQYQSECKECTRVRRSKWWKSESGRLSTANTKLKARFGITLDEYLSILKQQNYKCLICGISHSYMGHRLAVDHNHNTGKIRGLLCKGCNMGIGNFKENTSNLLKAVDYIKEKNNG